MILIKIEDSKRIEPLHPLLKTLFDYVKSHDFSQVPAGRIELDGKNLFINVDEPELRTKEEQKLEVHRRYMDVHFPLTCTEVIGWKAISDINISSEQPFDTEKDFAFYNEPASTYAEVHPGECMILYPEDAHAPIIGKGNMRKLVAKIKL